MVNATSLPPYLRERATLPIVEEVVWDPGPVCRSMVTSSPWSVAIPITPSPFNVSLQGFTGLRATISIECSCRNLTFPPTCTYSLYGLQVLFNVFLAVQPQFWPLVTLVCRFCTHKPSERPPQNKTTTKDINIHVGDIRRALCLRGVEAASYTAQPPNLVFIFVP